MCPGVSVTWSPCQVLAPCLLRSRHGLCVTADTDFRGQALTVTGIFLLGLLCADATPHQGLPSIYETIMWVYHPFYRWGALYLSIGIRLAILVWNCGITRRNVKEMCQDISSMSLRWWPPPPKHSKWTNGIMSNYEASVLQRKQPTVWKDHPANREEMPANHTFDD